MTAENGPEQTGQKLPTRYKLRIINGSFGLGSPATAYVEEIRHSDKPKENNQATDLKPDRKVELTRPSKSIREKIQSVLFPKDSLSETKDSKPQH